MSKIKRTFMLLACMVCGIVTVMLAQVTANAAEDEKSASQSYVEAMEPGWNLGNTFDSVDTNIDNPGWVDLGENAWGNPTVTKELIHNIKEAGFNSIRMPFTAFARVGEAPDYTISQTYLDRYAEVVNWALDEGLYVIADMEHVDVYCWAHNLLTDDGSAMAEYKALWTQFADYFKDYPEQLCFEPLNEPYFVGTTEEQLAINNEANTVFYNIVRNSGGNNASRMLLFPNLNTNAGSDECASNSNNILSLNDSNIIATFHYYSFWPFSVNIAGYTKFNDEVLNYAKDSIDLMCDNFIDKGIGVICGEYGILGDAKCGNVDHGEYLKYMEYVSSYGKEKGIDMVLWDNGAEYDRINYTWRDQPMLDTIITASKGERSSYTDSDTLYINGKTKNSALSTKVTLNGNELVSISNEDRELVLGEDYTYENGVVTFTESYMKNLIKDEYGICDNLVFKFSEGLDWDVSIDYYKMVVASDATGNTTDGLNIPMEFNGSKLATMEAVYSDGSGAGPNNWTTYKQFGDTFAPDYDNNILVVKSALLSECNDGEITLKLHWKDGHVTSYKLNKSGSVVTGTAVNTEDDTVVTEPDVDVDPEEPTIDPVTPSEDTDYVVTDDVKVNIDTTISGAVRLAGTIESNSDEAIDLSKLVIRYYFTKSDDTDMNFYAYNVSVNIGRDPWYLNLTGDVTGTFGSEENGSYVDIKINNDFELQQGDGAITLDLCLANVDWSQVGSFEGKGVVVYYDAE